MAYFIYFVCIVTAFVFLWGYIVVLYSKCEEIPKSVYEEDEECVDAFYDDDIYSDLRYHYLRWDIYDDD